MPCTGACNFGDGCNCKPKHGGVRPSTVKADRNRAMVEMWLDGKCFAVVGRQFGLCASRAATIVRRDLRTAFNLSSSATSEYPTQPARK